MSQVRTENFYLKSYKNLSPITETIPENDEFGLKNRQSSFSKKNSPCPLQYTSYNNSNKYFNKNRTIQNQSNHTRYNSVKLPLLIHNNDNCSFYKMKNYIVPIPKLKSRKNTNKINKIFFRTKTDDKGSEQENKKDRFNILLSKSGINRSDRKKTLSKSEDNPVMDFNDYLKMQSLADIRLRPTFGDDSLDLVNYINKVSVVRKNIMDNIMRELDSAENRYNSEKPEVDSKFRTKDKILLDNRWKNAFSLEEYQKFFSKNLKGKISSMNYRLMIKKNRQIALMCFCEGSPNMNSLKRMDYAE